MPKAQGTFLGHADPPLAPDALKVVGPRLSSLQAAAVYVSPLQRALETAACLNCSNITVLPELKEIGFGEWTGKTWTEIEANWRETAEQKLADWNSVTPPGGEPWDGFVCRVRNAWNCIRTGPWPAIVVAHHAVNAVLAELASHQVSLEFEQAWGEITELIYAPDRTDN